MIQLSVRSNSPHDQTEVLLNLDTKGSLKGGLYERSPPICPTTPMDNPNNAAPSTVFFGLIVGMYAIE